MGKHQKDDQQKSDDVDGNKSTQQSSINPSLAQENTTISHVSKQEVQNESASGETINKIEENISSAINFMTGFFLKPNTAEKVVQERAEFNHPDTQQERAAMRMSAQSRKTTTFENVEIWNKERIRKMNVHESVLNGLQQSVDHLLKASDENLRSICAFYKNVATQIRSPFAQQNQNPPKKINNEIYSNLHEAFNIFQEENKKKEDASILFSERVFSEIITQLLLPEEQRFNATATTIRNNLLNLKRQMKEQESKVNKKLFKMREVYAYNLNRNGNSIKQDFQLKLYSFLRHCNNLKEIQTIVVRATIGYWKKSIDLEKVRVKVIAAVLKIFNSLYADLCKAAGDPNLLSSRVLQLLKDQEVSEEHVIKCMDFNSVVTKEDQVYLSSQLKKEQDPETGKYNITIQEVFHFLFQIPINDFDESILPLKKLQLKREFQKNQYKNSTVIITPDCFLLCYDDPQVQLAEKEEEEESKESVDHSIHTPKMTEYRHFYFQKKPDFSMHMKEVGWKKNHLILQMKSMPSSGLISFLKQQQEVNLEFTSADRLEEFIQTVKSVESSQLYE